jgi:hypothetical protein
MCITFVSECCSAVDQLGSEFEKLKRLMTLGSSFIPTGNRTMPAWGKSGYSRCQLLFSWTELSKVPSFIRCYPIVLPFFLFHPSCFIDECYSYLFNSLKFVISLYFFCLYDVCHYIHNIRGTKSVKLCSGLVVWVDTCRKMFMRAGCAWTIFAVIPSSAGSITRSTECSHHGDPTVSYFLSKDCK